jgi:release factor H-coupled RctB family protein
MEPCGRAAPRPPLHDFPTPSPQPLTPMNTILHAAVRLIASPGAWMEGEAVRQLHGAARLPGVRQAVGFPDLHPGKGGPVGAAFVTDGAIYPHLIGGDIGCGMTLWKTDLLRRKARPDRWAEFRFDLEHPWEGNVGGWRQDNQLPSTRFDAAMGTLGAGNHFAEVQAIERVHDGEAFGSLGLDADNLVVLIHSGSRGYGESVLREFAAEHGATPVAPDSEVGASYLRAHDTAVRWARANREVIVRRFLEALGADGEMIWDGCHNAIQRRAGSLPALPGQAGSLSYVHRKGAVAAAGGPLVIAGSRGVLSYLVNPTGDGESHAWSLAHGAGRKWSRSASRARARERHHLQGLLQTPLGGRVVCESRDLLYEEAPMAYKPIEAVIGALEQAGLVEVIATLRPLLTYKTRAVRR